MAAGETREIDVPPEQGYGAWEEDKELWIDRAGWGGDAVARG